MNYNKKTVEDIDFKGKKVLLRVDFNVPMNNGQITDESRLEGALPTIKKLSEGGAKVILTSHMGKPKGEVKEELSLAPVAKRLGELLDHEVIFAKSSKVVDDEVRAKVDAMADGDIVLLENTRFVKGEEKNDPEFAKELASLADLYVNDAFGTAHRAHASTEGVTKFLSPKVAGYLIEKELKFLGEVISKPERPFVAILGGAKVSDKIKVIESLLDKVDTIIIGGGMAYTFQKAMGYEIGKSLLEEDRLDYAKEMLEKAKEKGVEILLPIDQVTGAEFKEDTEAHVTEDQNIPQGEMGLDIGPKTQELFAKAIANAKTVIWNGPMGVFEFEAFAKGTIAVAKAMAESSATTVIGGGDSAAAANQLGFGDKMTHISTGGGASLEFLEGQELPGIAALDDKKEK